MERLVRKALARHGASIRAFPTYHPKWKCQHFSSYLFYVTDWLADYSVCCCDLKRFITVLQLLICYFHLNILRFWTQNNVPSLFIHTLYQYSTRRHFISAPRRDEEAWRQLYYPWWFSSPRNNTYFIFMIHVKFHLSIFSWALRWRLRTEQYRVQRGEVSVYQGVHVCICVHIVCVCAWCLRCVQWVPHVCLCVCLHGIYVVSRGYLTCVCVCVRVCMNVFVCECLVERERFVTYLTID